ncbi:uncharacterized protein LOC116944914 isoform X1 [Petromyzon marinus]|uniref:uncharacterized protein LOC116944914 isoform X1 n=2 Tax=Petromyzon marinus TaxID=7757 RepID=UPI003F725349
MQGGAHSSADMSHSTDDDAAFAGFAENSESNRKFKLKPSKASGEPKRPLKGNIKSRKRPTAAFSTEAASDPEEKRLKRSDSDDLQLSLSQQIPSLKPTSGKYIPVFKSRKSKMFMLQKETQLNTAHPAEIRAINSTKHSIGEYSKLECLPHIVPEMQSTGCDQNRDSELQKELPPTVHEQEQQHIDSDTEVPLPENGKDLMKIQLDELNAVESASANQETSFLNEAYITSMEDVTTSLLAKSLAEVEYERRDDEVDVGVVHVDEVPINRDEHCHVHSQDQRKLDLNEEVKRDYPQEERAEPESTGDLDAKCVGTALNCQAVYPIQIDIPTNVVTKPLCVDCIVGLDSPVIQKEVYGKCLTIDDNEENKSNHPSQHDNAEGNEEDCGKANIADECQLNVKIGNGHPTEILMANSNFVPDIVSDMHTDISSIDMSFHNQTHTLPNCLEEHTDRDQRSRENSSGVEKTYLVSSNVCPPHSNGTESLVTHDESCGTVNADIESSILEKLQMPVTFRNKLSRKGQKGEVVIIESIVSSSHPFASVSNADMSDVRKQPNAAESHKVLSIEAPLNLRIETLASTVVGFQNKNAAVVTQQQKEKDPFSGATSTMIYSGDGTETVHLGCIIAPGNPDSLDLNNKAEIGRYFQPGKCEKYIVERISDEPLTSEFCKGKNIVLDMETTVHYAAKKHEQSLTEKDDEKIGEAHQVFSAEEYKHEELSAQEYQELAEINKNVADKQQTISVEHEHFSAEQHQDLSAKRQKLSTEQSKDLTTDEHQTFSADELKNISAEQSKALSADKHEDLTTDEHQTFSADELKNISAEQSKALSADKHEDLTTDEHQTFSADELKYISAEQSKALSADKHEDLTTDEHQTFSTDELKNISAEQYKALSAYEHKELSADKHEDLTTDEHQTFSADELKNISAEQSKALSADKHEDLTTDEHQTFSADELKNISAEQSKALSADKHEDLTTDEHQTFSADELKNISAEQYKELSAYEHKELSADKHEDLTTDEHQTFSADELKNISAEQYKVLSAYEHKELSADKHEDLTTDEHQTFSADELKHISAEQYKELSTEQSQELPTNEHKEELLVDNHTKISADEHKHISAEQNQELSTERSKTLPTDEHIEHQDFSANGKQTFPAEQYEESVAEEAVCVPPQSVGIEMDGCFVAMPPALAGILKQPLTGTTVHPKAGDKNSERSRKSHVEASGVVDDLLLEDSQLCEFFMSELSEDNEMQMNENIETPSDICIQEKSSEFVVNTQRSTQTAKLRDATDTVCRLINEISKINHQVLSVHRGLEAAKQHRSWKADFSNRNTNSTRPNAFPANATWK